MKIVKSLILLFIIISCNKTKINKEITYKLPAPPSKAENIYWVKKLNTEIEIDENLSHQKGFECDSVIGVDYIGFNGEDSYYPINEKGEFISSIKKKAKLTESQFTKLKSIIGNKKTYKNPRIVGCYEPRLGFIYYKKNKIVGQTQICLSCAQLNSTAKTIKDEYGNLFNEKATEQLNDLRIEIGFNKKEY
jgi:hypothetical protein